MPECIPDGFCLSDPDHLPSPQINLLYSHWQKCQGEGLELLIFLNASPLHGMSMKKSEKSKGKAKVGWVDVTTDDGEEEEEEEEEEKNEQKEDGNGEEEEGNDEGENKDAGGRNNDASTGMPLVIKYGPPQGKQKRIALSA